ncbi:restriction endonuclease subunit S [Glutamicibacter sp. MNS18]|uniref:restriction endonuclease subunit S n=1 Tax=Glutamicibacter sp. MNS18 TaxID=2989817 RepID=UPI0022360C0F|nr:restriction endonuclease subunit S [Glutamicibacter sp. MNS18]MCW4465647.1 restriction endonuclease subunit S [Glutamicibacter sp. MNS18]
MTNIHLTWADLGTTFDGPHATPQRVNEGPYFLNISSLNSGRLDLEKSDHVTPEEFAKWTRRVTPQKDDLLFSYETRLGEAALMPDGIEACLGRRMALLRPNREIVNPRFLLYFYLSPAFRQLIEQNTIHGATVNRIGLSTMGNWSLSIPPIDEQGKIAEVLGALDDKIATNNKIALTIEALGSARFRQLGLDTEPSNDYVLLGEYFDLNPRRNLKSDNPTIIDMQALPTTSPMIEQWNTGVRKGGARFTNGDTLIARITPCLENRKTAFVDFLRDGEVGIGSTEFIVLRSKNDLPLGLSYFMAISERFRDFAIQNLVGTSGRQRVSAADLARHTLTPAGSSEVRAFGEWADRSLQYLGSLREENRSLATTRDTLLPHLMSGKLRVKEVESLVESVV